MLLLGVLDSVGVSKGSISATKDSGAVATDTKQRPAQNLGVQLLSTAKNAALLAGVAYCISALNHIIRQGLQ